MTDDIVLTAIEDRGIATVTLNRPDVHNAYNSVMIRRLRSALADLAEQSAVRVVMLRANGKHFQAGADLTWLQESRALSRETNVEISQDTVDAVRGLSAFPKPTVALVHGSCIGGGVGIVASCDVVIASQDAKFAISEARWGLMAGPILSQLIARMGVAKTKRYAMTCETFDAELAESLGLVDEVCATGSLDEAAEPFLQALLRAAPEAAAATKHRTLQLASQIIDDELARCLAEEHAGKRLSEEAGEGLRSFVERSPVPWHRSE